GGSVAATRQRRPVPACDPVRPAPRRRTAVAARRQPPPGAGRPRPVRSGGRRGSRADAPVQGVRHDESADGVVLRAVRRSTRRGLKEKKRHAKTSSNTVSRHRLATPYAHAGRFCGTFLRDVFARRLCATPLLDVVIYFESFRTTAASRDLCLAALL